MKHGSNTDEYRAAVRVIHGAATGRKSCQCTIRALPLLSSLKGIRLLLVLPGPGMRNLGFANGLRIPYNKYSTSALACPEDESRGRLDIVSNAPFIRPAEETSRMTSRLAQWTTWNLLALWLVTAGARGGVGSRPPDHRAFEHGPGWRPGPAQLIATGQYGDGSVRDLTHAGTWASSDPAIVVVHPGGRIEPRGDGEAEVLVRTGSSEAKATIQVRNSGKTHPIRFEHEVLPALTKLGCNAGACHGTPAGKNGFRLSLRGFDPALDFVSLRARTARGVPTRSSPRQA